MQTFLTIFAICFVAGAVIRVTLKLLSPLIRFVWGGVEGLSNASDNFLNHWANMPPGGYQPPGLPPLPPPPDPFNPPSSAPLRPHPPTVPSEVSDGHAR